jgi:EmrB/QacA subfamily drug resistance transporter
MTANPAGPQADSPAADPSPGTPAGVSAATPAAGRGRWLAMVAMAASVLVVGLDLTILNLALPSIATGLHASTSDLQWIADAYSLVLAALVLPAGLLGDRYGRKRLLVVALVIFGASSLWCAYCNSTGELIAARAVLGIGAAAIFPLALSVLPVLFAPEERPKAIAAISGATMLSFPIGPILGGFLLSHFWWGSVFLINVPVVVLAVAAVAFLLPESRSARRPSIDLSGLLVSCAGLLALTYGAIKAGQDGWSDVTAIALIVGGIVILALLYPVERRIARQGGQPLADLRLFSFPGFRWGTILATTVSFAMFGLFFALPQYFQDVRGASPLGSGIRLLPMVGGMIIGMVTGTRLKMPRIAITVGYLLMAAAMALGALTTLTSSTGYTVAWVALSGLGLGLVMPTAMTAAMGDLSSERAGAGSALITALRQVGSTVGVAILGTVISNAYSSQVAGAVSHLSAGAAAAVKSGAGSGVAVAQQLGSADLLHSVRTAFVHGMDQMLWVCGGIAIACALLAVTVLRTRQPGPAEVGADGPTDSVADDTAGSLPVD